MPTHTDMLDLFEKLIQTTHETDGDRKIISALLHKYANRLNQKFAELFKKWAFDKIAQLNPEQAQLMAVSIGRLSDTLLDFQSGEKEENVEIAIAGYEVVSRVILRGNHPQYWATLQMNMGKAYVYRIKGKKSENLEKAIKFSELALEVYTREVYSKEWGDIQNNLSEVYCNRIKGGKAENLEEAIIYAFNALEVHRRDTFPNEWADAKINLANAYLIRIKWEQAENIELAIKFYIDALKAYTRKAFPDRWATNHLNLGNAYLHRIRGEKAENIERAILLYKNALQVYTHETFPERWADTTSNMGVAYSKQIKGGKVHNLKLAINCYLDVLKVRQRFPMKWADTQNNLGEAYRPCSILGEQPVENLERAISYYLAALEVHSFEEFPYEWAKIQHNLGGAYCQPLQGENPNNLELGIRSFLAALKVRTREAFPQDYMLTQLNLGMAYQEARQYHNAYSSFKSAIETLEDQRNEIVFGSAREEDKQKLAEDWNGLYRRMVEVCLELGYYNQALEYVESSKSRNLVELIVTRDRHSLFPPEVVSELDRLRDEIASVQEQLQTATAVDSAALAQRRQQLRQERNELQERYLRIGSSFKFNEFRTTLDARTVIVEFYIAGDKLLTFIFTQQNQPPIVQQSQPKDLKKLEKWANGYLNAYYYKNCHWKRRLTTRLNLLTQILHLDEILSEIPQECDRLIFIPHRFLHLFPLHALPVNKNSSLFKRFSQGVQYAPSCQLLQLIQKRHRSNFTKLFAIQNPTENLDYADLEVEAIKEYFNSADILEKASANKAMIGSDRLSGIHCAHFSCHGYFNLANPRKSVLILANAELNSVPPGSAPEHYLNLQAGEIFDLNKCLTLEEIFNLELQQCRLVTLSACETGLIDFHNKSDEYIGLPSAFIYAGSSSVISSLWKVDDLSTAFLMIRFYQNLHNGCPVDKSLNQAQLWLRDATKAELERWVEENRVLSRPTLRIRVRRYLHQLPENDSQPFRNCFYWAGFCATGS